MFRNLQLNLCLFVLSALVLPDRVLAKDLGTLGTLYPVAEKDLIEELLQRVRNMQANGELKKRHDKLVEKGKSYARRPAGTRLPRVKEYRMLKVDLSLTLQEDIRDAKGRVLHPKGRTVNPLDYRSLTKKLCFIDADDKDQIAWSKRYCEKKDKIILVNGDFLETTKTLERRVYFDQRGALIDRFGINAVPAIVRQIERALYVEEIPLD